MPKADASQEEEAVGSGRVVPSPADPGEDHRAIVQSYIDRFRGFRVCTCQPHAHLCPFSVCELDCHTENPQEMGGVMPTTDEQAQSPPTDRGLHPDLAAMVASRKSEASPSAPSREKVMPGLPGSPDRRKRLEEVGWVLVWASFLGILVWADMTEPLAFGLLMAPVLGALAVSALTIRAQRKGPLTRWEYWMAGQPQVERLRYLLAFVAGIGIPLYAAMFWGGALFGGQITPAHGAALVVGTIAVYPVCRWAVGRMRRMAQAYYTGDFDLTDSEERESHAQTRRASTVNAADAGGGAAGL